MERSIWKFPLVVDDAQVITVPEDFEVLSLQEQGGKPCLWALVGWNAQPESSRWSLPRSEVVHRTVLCFGTGHPVPKDVKKENYIGTVQTGSFVWHYFWGE